MEEKLKSQLTALPSSTVNLDEQLSTSCRHYFEEKILFKPASRPDPYLERINSRYRPLNPKMPEQNAQSVASHTGTASSSSRDSQNLANDSQETTKDGIPPPKRVLFDPGRLEMKWKSPKGVGSGLGNMGNTCFLNSVLQCLTYTPPLYNYLTSDHHKNNCRGQGFCSMCELQRHVQRAMNQSGGVVRPSAIVQNLRVIGKNFRQGRQEDAHEFLRYFVDGLQKSSLHGVPSKLDPHSKATTIVHQVFGGYHCSQVRCKKCQKVSETYDPLLDLSLDIRSCKSLQNALNQFIKPDALEGDNQYACPFCKEMTPALKKFTIHRLPNILTIQLKRFDYNSLFGGKINKPVSYTHQLNMRPFLTDKKGPPQWYQLYGVLVHSGYSCHSGHYYCYIRSSNKVWYCLNDSQVYQTSANQVLQQEAYLLFYARDRDYQPPATPTQPKQLVKPNTQAGPGTPQPGTVRLDPNFLGQSIKRPPGVDKTGTPLIKRKPTGVVPPSPQTASRKPAPPTTADLSLTLPLRKSDVDRTPTPAPVIATPPKPTAIPVKKPPMFTPRVIVTPSKKKHQRLQMVKCLGSSKVVKAQTPHELHGERQTSIGVSDTPVGTQGESGEGDASTPMQVSSDRTILDFAEMGESVPPQPGTPDQEGERFIGPLLPPHLQRPVASPLSASFSQAKSPKIARVQPQIKPAKPIARVQPVVLEIPVERAAKTSKSGGSHNAKSGESLASPEDTRRNDHSVSNAAASRTPQSQNVTSQWKPVDTPVPAEASFHHMTPDSESPVTEAHNANESDLPQQQQQEEVKKRRKHKKKKKKKKKKRSHRHEESGESEREQKHSRAAAAGEKSKKSSHISESSEEEEEEEILRNKNKKRESRKERPRSRRQHSRSRSPHRRERSRSSSAGDKSDERERYYRHEKKSRERHREDRRHDGGHRDSEKGRREERKHDKHHHSSSSSARSAHKPRRHSPSPDRSRNRRKRHRSYTSSESEDDYSRRKSRKQDSHHLQKKHHSAEQNRKHRHDKIRKTKHLSEKTEKTRSSSSSSLSPNEKRSSKVHSHHHKHSRRDEGEGKAKPEMSSSGCDQERDERKRLSSHAKTSRVSSSDEKDSRREKTVAMKNEGTALRDVPVVEWDSSLRDEGGKGQAAAVGGSWDGSRSSQAVVAALTSHTHNQLGDNVKSWEGGENSVDGVSVSGEWKKREADAWDQELDKGKVKSVKGQKESHFPQRNPFQQFQNKKNVKTGSGTK